MPEERFGASTTEEAIIEKISKENKELKEKQEKYHDIIVQLKRKLETESKGLKEVKTKELNKGCEDTELKDHFLNCIEEIRKDIIKRNVISARQVKTARPIKGRLPFQTSREGSAAEDNIYMPKLSNFTAGDKRRVIKMLLGNEAVLMKIYEALFTKGGKNPVTTLPNSNKNTRFYM